MIKEITASGKDILEAKENARLALGADELADVKYEILHAGSKGIFGIIGVKPAMVKASIELPDPAPRRERRENKSADAPKAETKPSENAAQDNAETSEPHSQKKSGNRNKNRRKGNGNADRKPHAPVEKASAVFESELTFEKKEVAPGEDKAYDFVCHLIRDMGIEAKVELLICGDGTRRINVEGEAASALIGHHGDTLDALQYLANLASAQRNDAGEKDKSRVTVNIEGYRAKREETLRTLARAMAAKALRTGKNVMLEPMNPYERRIIHSEIQLIDGVYTNSVGTENNRKVVIYPERNNTKNQNQADASASKPEVSDTDENKED